jgi:hypothetical protein
MHAMQLLVFEHPSEPMTPRPSTLSKRLERRFVPALVLHIRAPQTNTPAAGIDRRVESEIGITWLANFESEQY